LYFKQISVAYEALIFKLSEGKMTKKRLQFGIGGMLVPPAELNVTSVQRYEKEGFDFVAYWDILCSFIPRSIWTPDIVPAAEYFDIDCYMDAYALMAQAAAVTSKIEIGLFATDSLRRPPAILAQSFLTIDHIAKGRAWFAMGAGEAKQFAPYGLPREKPLAHLEECLKIIRLLGESDGLVDYEGPIWNLKNAILSLPPYNKKMPPLYVVTGPGRGMEICGKYSDGWGTFLPPTGSPEWYAEQVKNIKQIAEANGKDPEQLDFIGGVMAIIAPTEDLVDQATQSPALRWDAAALVSGPDAWKRFGQKNPLGEGWSYPRDLIPMDWSREDTLKIASQVAPEMLRNLRSCGTPQSVADQLQPYIDAGVNKILIANYAELVLTGGWGDATSGNGVISQTYDIIRKRNGMPTMADSVIGN
jgi:phthiodiolone/phenolphthiodiolone dimycocerosates ketoreductase